MELDEISKLIVLCLLTPLCDFLIINILNSYIRQTCGTEQRIVSPGFLPGLENVEKMDFFIHILVLYKSHLNNCFNKVNNYES